MKKILASFRAWLRRNFVYFAASFSVSESIFHAVLVLGSAVYLVGSGAVGSGIAIIAFALMQVVFAFFLASRAIRNHQLEKSGDKNLTLVVA